ncbi:unnamed protein product [Rotaria sp. Silwood2]|nr:unnamed protein product [Rotaria sp. Silwood2]CAF4466297.1 unnamed protein product [Rotaria sp. Silwood2]
MLFFVAQFVPAVDPFLFGQPKLECKPCICHPECHCETKCVQQQIMKECNLGVDSHNIFASHYTQENRTTRLILLFSLIINFLLTLLLLFRKTVCNCYREHQLQKRQQKQIKQQAAARQQTERYTIALKQIITPHAEKCPPKQSDPHTTSDQPLFQFLSNLNIEDSV